MTDPAHLVVSRRADVLRDQRRAYLLLVDGVFVGQIWRGGTWTVAVPPGRHQIEVRIDWSGSRAVEFEVPVGGVVRFQVEPAGKLINGAWQMFTRHGWLRLTKL